MSKDRAEYASLSLSRRPKPSREENALYDGLAVAHCAAPGSGRRICAGQDVPA